METKTQSLRNICLLKSDLLLLPLPLNAMRHCFCYLRTTSFYISTMSTCKVRNEQGRPN